MSSLDPLLTRRSVSVKELTAPAPSVEELEPILRAATRVPDHGKLCPWRIVVLTGDGQKALGQIARERFAALHQDATPEQLKHEELRFTRAPLVLAVLSTPTANRKAVWEQELSAGAVCMNILHAVHGLGYGAKWLSEWVAYDDGILEALLAHCPNLPRENALPARIAGLIYIGSKTAEPEDRERPALADIVGKYR